MVGCGYIGLHEVAVVKYKSLNSCEAYQQSTIKNSGLLLSMYTIFLPIMFCFFKLEGMFRPPKIPSNHPSFVEVEEDENVVEKFKEGMMSVRNILALDRLKQEVCLKEKLAKSGQLLHSSHNTSTIDEEEITKVYACCLIINIIVFYLNR